VLYDADGHVVAYGRLSARRLRRARLLSPQP